MSVGILPRSTTTTLIEMSALIIDLGLNNVASIERALRLSGFDSLRVVADARDFRNSDLLVLPGVGAFGVAMASIRNRGFEEVIKGHVKSGGYLMGVCLGMQMLFDSSSESPESHGLGLVSGEVVRIAPRPEMRIPHVGWTALEAVTSPFGELETSSDFYFVHSYEANPSNPSVVIAHAHYGSDRLTAAILQENIVGFQFHPEKSSKPGSRLLRQVKAWSGA